MTIETLTITRLVASEGHYLTDGTVYDREFLIAKDRSPDEYTEITDAEYEEKMKETAGEVILEDEPMLEEENE